MKTDIPEKIVAARKSRGLSQDALAHKASINLRTLQRIENGQTVPRGHTLGAIAMALQMPLEHFTAGPETKELGENRQFLQWMTLSCLSFWIFPLTNVFAPMLLRRLKKNSIHGAEALGNKIVSFQARWSAATYGLLLVTIILSALHPSAMPALLPLYFIITVGLLYLFNTACILVQFFKILKKKYPLSKPVLMVSLILTTCSGCLFSQSRTAEKFFPPLGKLVDIGGWKLHLLEAGTAKKGPSVILEAGVGDFSFDWTLVQSRVAAFARVYAYDRAGSAWSDLGPAPHTMQQTVYELHTLLHKARVPGPYVMVGASYGGLLVRLFARSYPDEVAGMVLVDAGYEDGVSFINGKKMRPSVMAEGKPVPAIRTAASDKDNHLAQSTEGKKAIGDALRSAGLPHPYLDPPYDKLPDAIQKIRLWAVGQLEYYAGADNPYMMEEKALTVQYRKEHSQALGSKPLIVLTRGRTDKPDTDPAEIERKQVQLGFTELSSNSKQVIADNSGHHIQLERPELVAAAIHEVAEAVIHHRLFKK